MSKVLLLTVHGLILLLKLLTGALLNLVDLRQLYLAFSNQAQQLVPLLHRLIVHDESLLFDDFSF